MKRLFLLVGLALLGLAAVFLGILFGSDERYRTVQPAYASAAAPVQARVALPVAQVQRRLLAQMGADSSDGPGHFYLSRPQWGPPFRDFGVWTNEHGSVDMAFRKTETGFSSDAPVGTQHVNLAVQDPGLPAYLALPAHARRYDLRVEPARTSRWTADDVQADGSALPYSSDYLVHLTASDSGATDVRVLGVDANVVVGERWSVMRGVLPSLPHRVPDERAAPPSPADKRALLLTLLRMLDPP